MKTGNKAITAMGMALLLSLSLSGCAGQQAAGDMDRSMTPPAMDNTMDQAPMDDDMQSMDEQMMEGTMDSGSMQGDMDEGDNTMMEDNTKGMRQ